MTSKAGKPVIAVHGQTGALEQYSSIQGAVIVMRNIHFRATTHGVRKACNTPNLKYLDRYWEFVE